MSNSTQADVTPGEWTGVYYDAEAGEMVTIEFQDDGTVALISIDGGDPMHTFNSHADFADAATEFIQIPPHAVDDPVAVALQAYNKGYEQIMNHELEGDIALMYADTQVEIVEKDE